MTYRTLALAGALVCALAAPPAEADPLADFFASFDPPAREARLHPSSAGWRRIRPAPMRAIEPNGSPLISVAQRYLGAGNFTGLRAPWCAAALRVWLARAGFSAPRSNRARDFAHYGRPAHLHAGAILVWPHHVGIYAGDGRVISGNAAGHRVSIGRRSLRGVIAVRAPT